MLLGKETLNTIIFSVFILVIILYLRKWGEEKYIQKVSKKICTPIIIQKFHHYLSEKDSKDKFKDKFNEYDISVFLSKELIPKNRLCKFLTTRILNIYDDITVDSLKDIFVYNLLNKQLIGISGADGLDRNFATKKSYYDFDFYDLI